MAKLKKLSSRLVVFVILVLSFTRVMVARIIPWVQSPDKAPAMKIFALTDAQWLELRAVDDKNSSQQTAEKKTPPPDTDVKDEQAKPEEKKPKKSDEKNTQKPECKPKIDAKNSPQPADKDTGATTEPPCDEASPGGGDGDMGGTGG